MKRIVVCAALIVTPLLPAAAAAQMPPTLVEAGTVTSREFNDQITLVGRTEASSNSRIVAEVSGRVIRVDAKEGNAVRRGDVLVSIDPDRIRLALEAKRAQVAQARATADLAEKQLARSQDLAKQDLVAQGGLDVAIAEHARASAQYDQFVAEMKQLELDLEKCSIRSPFNGYTVRQLVSAGEGVAAGTAVYEVVDITTVKVFVDLPERHFGNVDKGSKVTVLIAGDSNEPVTGVVTGVAPSAGQDTHTFPVIIGVDNKDHRLGSGMLVRVTLSLRKTFTSLAVSKDAIVRQGNSTIVYTIADGKAAPVPVVTGSTDGNFIAISGDGVSDGMTVIVRGNERVYPGSPVRTADGAPGAGTAAEEKKADDGEKPAAGDEG